MTAKVSQHQAGATQFRQPSSHCGCLAALATDTTCSIHNENSRWNPLSRYIKMILTDVRLYGAHVFPSSSHFEDWQLNLRGGACRKPEEGWRRYFTRKQAVLQCRKSAAPKKGCDWDRFSQTKTQSVAVHVSKLILCIKWNNDLNGLCSLHLFQWLNYQPAMAHSDTLGRFCRPALMRLLETAPQRMRHGPLNCTDRDNLTL